MLTPGLLFASGRVDITAGAGQTPNYMNQGLGFMTNGTLAVDTNAVSGTNWMCGLRLSAAGAVYGTTSANASDVVVGGVRVSSSGQLVYEAAAASTYNNGNPVTSNGRFASI